jgi:hypothetical protein
MRDEMLAAAKADLKPDFAWAERKQRGRVGDLPRLDFEPRQQRLDQSLVMRAQRLAAAAPIERAPRRLVRRGAILRAGARQETRPRNLSPRSVFSQEKPPWESGWRPKWP